MFVRDVAARLDLQSRDFGIEPEITCKVARMRARVYEMPISYEGRTYEEGKKIGVKDAFKAVWVLLKYWRWEAPADDVGAITLRRMSVSFSPYNRWLHDRFEHYLGSRILEVGSGVGNQTRYFIDAREQIIASDVEPHYVRELTAKFSQHRNVRIASYRFPLTDDARTDLRDARLDSIVCMNVLEHIEDDAATLRDFAQVLQPGGHLVLLVPAMKSLYGSMDRYLGHYRRYAMEELRAAVSNAGFDIETIRFLNRPCGTRLVVQRARAEAPRDAQESAQGIQVGNAVAQARREDASQLRSIIAGARSSSLSRPRRPGMTRGSAGPPLALQRAYIRPLLAIVLGGVAVRLLLVAATRSAALFADMQEYHPPRGAPSSVWRAVSRHVPDAPQRHRLRRPGTWLGPGEPLLAIRLFQMLLNVARSLCAITLAGAWGALRGRATRAARSLSTRRCCCTASTSCRKCSTRSCCCAALPWRHRVRRLPARRPPASFAGLANLTRSAGLALLPVVPAIVGWSAWRLGSSRARTALLAMACVAGFVCSMIPWVYRNVTTFGEARWTDTSGGVVFLMANNPIATAVPSGFTGISPRRSSTGLPARASAAPRAIAVDSSISRSGRHGPRS